MAMMQMVEGSLCDVQCNAVVDCQSDYGSSKQVEILKASMVVLCLCPNLATGTLSERVPTQHSECRFGAQCLSLPLPYCPVTVVLIGFVV